MKKEDNKGMHVTGQMLKSEHRQETMEAIANLGQRTGSSHKPLTESTEVPIQFGLHTMTMSKAAFRVWFFDFLYDRDPEMAEDISMGTEDYDLGGEVYEAMRRFKEDKWVMEEHINE